MIVSSRWVSNSTFVHNKYLNTYFLFIANRTSLTFVSAETEASGSGRPTVSIALGH